MLKNSFHSFTNFQYLFIYSVYPHPPASVFPSLSSLSSLAASSYEDTEAGHSPGHWYTGHGQVGVVTRDTCAIVTRELS